MLRAADGDRKGSDKMKIEIDHIGYAVKSIDVALPIFQQFGYVFEEFITDEARNFVAGMGKLGNMKVELLMPYRGGKFPA